MIFSDVGLIGVPFDEAIVAGGGRSGAQAGPEAIRKELKQLKIVDFGDVEVVAGDTIRTHQRVTEMVTTVLEKGIFPIVIGGGHDLSFATIRALAEHSKGQVGGINVDAHLDVRPVKDGVISSGTPFRRALEELGGKVEGKRFVELAVSEKINAEEHHQYLRDKGAKVMTLFEFREKGMDDVMDQALLQVGETAFFDIDIDVVQRDFAPGCSAPALVGLTSDEIVKIAFRAGKASNIKLFNLMEVSPKYDVDGKTVRLAVAILENFLAGYSLRSG